MKTIVFISFLCVISMECHCQTWLPVGGGMNGFAGLLCVYNNKLYVGGTYTMAGGITANDIAVWNGSKWDSLGSGIKHKSGGGLGVVLGYDSVLYAAGQFYG